ncbi:MAG: GDYXXLXY domain-containing protein [Cyanobacteria bacterium P01_A01_bin.135]
MATPTPLHRRWAFWLPLVLQLGLILAAPARAIYTHTTGETVLLQTAPVDPYDLLRGYYVTLSYQISASDTLDELPGWQEIKEADRQSNLPLYVVLAPPEGASGDQPWTPVSISRDRPQLSSGQVALRGTYQWGRVVYGLERYYIPEDQRGEINERIRQQHLSEPEAYLIEVKVDARGQSAPVSLWVGEKNYRF